MYKYISRQIKLPIDFMLPFGGKLNTKNRWIKLAEMIPWEQFEEEYAKNFKKSRKGEIAHNVRVALGTLIIKERLGLSDEETVNHISENPYLQYFIGFEKFVEEMPFNPSQLTHFRKRFPSDMLNRINEAIIAKCSKDNDDNNPSSTCDKKNTKNENTPNNSGTLMLDATCTPADIQYPTDVRLLNDARELLERIIDTLHFPDKGKEKRPRTYRNKARKEYINFTKNRKPTTKVIRKMRGKLLRYVRRIMNFTHKLADKNGLELLSNKQYKNLLVINELYHQQLMMQNSKSFRINDRIVSINQPHVRPIVRGKASGTTEFGAKLEISIDNGFVHCEVISWDAYNESTTLIKAVERYKERKGYYPEVVLADQIYRSRNNKNYCKSNQIRLSGPSLGRKSEEVKKEEKKQAYRDSCRRNNVESKFGEGKRKYSLGKIMTKLTETSATTIVLNLIIMNLEKKMRFLLYVIYKYLNSEKFKIIKFQFTSL
jgi:DNA-directed RNA polymerase subunit E'/Rpb7